MAWQQSDRAPERTAAISMLRGALIDEISATDLYDKLIALLPEYADILDEIKTDEINHQGRLMDLIMQEDKTQMEPFNAGLEQKDVGV